MFLYQYIFFIFWEYPAIITIYPFILILKSKEVFKWPAAGHTAKY